MIRIDLDETRLMLTVKGHAQAEESEEYRHICAGVSAIAQGMAYCLAKWQKEKDSLLAMDYRPDKGDLLLQVQPEDWARPGARRRMAIFGDGLEMMAVCHPESIEMTRNGENVAMTAEVKESERD